MKFECWNPKCGNYAGAGVRLQKNEVREDNDRPLSCTTCGTTVRAAAPEHTALKTFVVTLFGAAIGWLFGEFEGAFAGAIIGSLFGWIVAHPTY